MRAKVRFDPAAEIELAYLYDYIRDRCGAVVAEAYIRRIVAHCMRLADFPERGTNRSELRPGLRTMGFERRATIAFVVEDSGVTILRILYGGRDVEA